jgi:predicted O-linked N-acetylglucosamine transferase (SPINDLY family)
MNPKKPKPKRQTRPPQAEVSALIALYNAQRFAEVESQARRLIGKFPDAALLWKLLGASLQMQGKDALPALQNAAKLSPQDAEAHNNLGVVLQERGQLDGALASYRNALMIDPGFVEAHYNLGNVLSELGRLEEAVASYGNALKFNPDIAVIHSNLGAALQELGRLDEALSCCRRALELEPGLAAVHSNLLGMLNSTSGYNSAHRLEEARKYGRMVSRKVSSRFTAWQCEDPPRRLRVGMVSGDLHNHPVGYFLESLLANLDPARVELIAYPTDLTVDALTARIKPNFTIWKPLYSLNDADAARLIHADGVHVLLDLSGHTEQNRLPIFAWKPAPVQAAWLGYFATTGIPEMDYLLADEVGVPEAQRKNFTESIWYLPDTRLCFSAPEVDLPVATLPALQNGHITFGCFQRLNKVGDDVLIVWGKILSALPNARLRWQCKQLGDPAGRAQFVERLRQHGIDPARVTMHGTVSRESYLGAHAEVDMILDTFPFPGGTTTCEALWMGVPTLTLAGETLLARQGASLLTAAGLGEWIATSVEDYIGKAVALSSDLPRLAALRAGLREQVRVSPLFDARRFARNFEDALWGMWQARTRNDPSTPSELLTAARD